MSIENNKITGSQFLFTVACFIQASSLLTSFFLSISQQDSWLVVIVSVLLYLPFAFVLMTIVKRFPDKNLIQVNNIIFGKVLGKVVSLLYLFYFISLASLNLRDLSFFVQKTIMHNTPGFIILLLFLSVVAWTVRYGIDVTTRFNTLFSIVSLTVTVASTLLITSKIDLGNFLPMLQMPTMTYIQSTHIVSAIPFGELVVILMITPSVKAESKKITRLFFCGILLGAINLLLVVFRDTGVLGNLLTRFTMPAFESLRLITIGQTLSRVEILFATVLIVLLFSKVSLLFYVSALAIAQIFNLKGYRPLIISLGVLLFVYSITMYESGLQHMREGSNTHPFIWLLFEFALPIIIMASMLIRDLKSDKGAINLGLKPNEDPQQSSSVTSPENGEGNGGGNGGGNGSGKQEAAAG